MRDSQPPVIRRLMGESGRIRGIVWEGLACFRLEAAYIDWLPPRSPSAAVYSSRPWIFARGCAPQTRYSRRTEVPNAKATSSSWEISSSYARNASARSTERNRQSTGRDTSSFIRTIS